MNPIGGVPAGSKNSFAQIGEHLFGKLGDTRHNEVRAPEKCKFLGKLILRWVLIVPLILSKLCYELSTRSLLDYGALNLARSMRSHVTKRPAGWPSDRLDLV